MRSLISFAFLAISVAGVTPAMAQQKFENLDRLDSLVAMTVGANLGEPGGPASPIDRRLHLGACPQTPSVDGPVFGAAIVKCDPLGWRIRVALVPGGAAAAAAPVGRAAMAPAARQAAVVRRGDPVQLQAGNQFFSVSRPMVADEDGAMGEMIRVREDKKSAPVIAQVVQMGIVRIPGI